MFLSCCETNLTLTQITDDPLSIASGFLCAGARNVVSTLWAVDDLATALFCILYYEEKQDKSRSEAIRQAQIKLRNLTGDELSAKYRQQLEDYFEQQQLGENKAEIVKKCAIAIRTALSGNIALCQSLLLVGFCIAGFILICGFRTSTHKLRNHFLQKSKILELDFFFTADKSR